MKSKGKKILFYMGAVLLAVFYLCVLWWGQNPKVGLEYRMYYITHELSDWPGYGKLSYASGTTEYCTALKDRNGTEVSYQVCQRKGQGWQKEQYEGSKNSGQEAYLYYVLEETLEHAEYVCEINQFTGTGMIEVYCNDKKAGTIQHSGVFTFEIGELDKEELVTIRFVAQDCDFSLWSTMITEGSPE